MASACCHFPFLWMLAVPYPTIAGLGSACINRHSPSSTATLTLPYTELRKYRISFRRLGSDGETTPKSVSLNPSLSTSNNCSKTISTNSRLMCCFDCPKKLWVLRPYPHPRLPVPACYVSSYRSSAKRSMLGARNVSTWSVRLWWMHATRS